MSEQLDKKQIVFDFVKTYPPLKEKLQYNALEIQPKRFSVSTVTNDEVFRRYTANKVKKRFVFAITGITSYDKQGISNINLDEAAEFDKFSAWVKEQYKAGNYPNIGNVTKVSASKPDYDGNNGTDLAKYSFMLTIEYLEQED